MPCLIFAFVIGPSLDLNLEATAFHFQEITPSVMIFIPLAEFLLSDQSIPSTIQFSFFVVILIYFELAILAKFDKN